MLLLTFSLGIALCVSHPLHGELFLFNKLQALLQSLICRHVFTIVTESWLGMTGKPSRHPPVFDGTDQTVPQNLTDSSVINKIEEINEGTVFGNKIVRNVITIPHSY